MSVVLMAEPCVLEGSSEEDRPSAFAVALATEGDGGP
jgi:hypothetical protein